MIFLSQKSSLNLVVRLFGGSNKEPPEKFWTELEFENFENLGLSVLRELKLDTEKQVISSDQDVAKLNVHSNNRLGLILTLMTFIIFYLGTSQISEIFRNFILIILFFQLLSLGILLKNLFGSNAAGPGISSDGTKEYLGQNIPRLSLYLKLCILNNFRYIKVNERTSKILSDNIKEAQLLILVGFGSAVLYLFFVKVILIPFSII